MLNFELCGSCIECQHECCAGCACEEVTNQVDEDDFLKSQNRAENVQTYSASISPRLNDGLFYHLDQGTDAPKESLQGKHGDDFGESTLVSPNFSVI
jgi:hypothetical protein